MASREVPAAFDAAASVSHAAALTKEPRICYNNPQHTSAVSLVMVQYMRASMLEVLTSRRTSRRTTEFHKQPGFIVSIAEASEMALEQAYLLPAGIRPLLIAWAETQFSAAEEARPLISA